MAFHGSLRSSTKVSPGQIYCTSTERVEVTIRGGPILARRFPPPPKQKGSHLRRGEGGTGKSGQSRLFGMNATFRSFFLLSHLSILTHPLPFLRLGPTTVLFTLGYTLGSAVVSVWSTNRVINLAQLPTKLCVTASLGIVVAVFPRETRLRLPLRRNIGDTIFSF